MLRLLGNTSRNVLLLGVVSFITDASSELIMPILPMFIASIGGAGIAVGLIGGLGDSLSSIMNIFSGHFSDRLGKRKPFIYLGYGLSALMKLFYPFSRVWPQLLLFRVLERTGKGIRTAPRDAIIAESAKKEVRGKAFGIHRALDTSGAIGGSILAFVLFWFLNLGFESMLLIAAFIAFIALPPIHFVKEEEKKPVERELRIGLKGLSRELKLFILIASVFALANFTYMFFILKAQQAFTAREAIGIPILLYILFNLVYALLAIPAGVLSDRIGRPKVLLMGYMAFALTSLGFAFASSLLPLIALFTLYGSAFALIDANQRALVSDLADKDLRGTALGTFHTSIGIATLASGVVAGTLWEYVSPNVTFLYGGGVAVMASLLLVFYQKA